MCIRDSALSPLPAAKRRAEEIKRQERSRRSRIAAVSGAAACLAAILGLALAMPSVTARFSGADYYGGMTASLFTGESLGYLLVGLRWPSRSACA